MLVSAAVLLMSDCFATTPEKVPDAKSPPAEIIAGSWWINGNGHSGYLNLQVAADGKVEGTVYDQPLIGKFDAAKQQIVFKRLQKTREGTPAVQEFTGTLKQIMQKPPTFKLEGTFQSLAGGEWGKAGTDYRWTAQITRPNAPAVDVQDLQGDWKVSGVFTCLDKEVKLPAELHLDRDSAVAIRGNELLFAGKSVAKFDNDLGSKKIQGEVGFTHYRPLMITPPGGKELLCSYLIFEDKVEIAYPHTTSCHRGSGHIVVLKRPQVAK